MPADSPQPPSPPVQPPPLLPWALPMEAPRPPLTPVSPGSRVVAIDVLRGFAVLGILWMNLLAYALPQLAYMNPMNEAVNRYAGEFRDANFLAWLASYLFVDQKFMTIFSMLFGAGLVLMSDRAGGGRFAGIYYRRLLWLLIIGMIHAYLFWYGDILVPYAVAGLLLYPVRNWRPTTLIWTGVAVMSVAMVIFLMIGGLLFVTRYGAERGNRDMEAAWADIQADMNPTPEAVDEEVAAMRGSWPQVVRANAAVTLEMQAIVFPMMLGWRIIGVMMLGMGLMKLGVFSAERSHRFYMRLSLIGLGVGLPLLGLGAWDQIAHRFEFLHAMLIGWHYNYVGSVFMAIAYVSFLMLVVQAHAPNWLTRRLAAVGRMALTNYLAQTLICTTLFLGWGFGLFGRIERAGLLGVMLAIWIAQLLWSSWWLERFRFGPVEWLWRSLTYRRIQPMRAPAAAPAPPAVPK